MNESLTIVDTHVHIYDFFPLVKFFDAAKKNFATQANRRQSSTWVGVLLLTESQGDQWFAQLGACAEKAIELNDGRESSWIMTGTQEKGSLKATSTSGDQLIVVAGRQIVTKEKLEVLALLTEHGFPDGAPLAETVEAIRKNEGVPVAPWAFGKWWGERGKVLARYLDSSEPTDMFLGDNSGRPGFLPEPSHFIQAKRQGRRILPGSDPLPLPTEYWRPGCAGILIADPISPETPAQDLKRILLNPHSSLMLYHQPEPFVRFARNFIALRATKP